MRSLAFFFFGVFDIGTPTPVPVPGCNGSPYFCDLALDAYVWPGTHKSGSSQKVSPGTSNDIVSSNRDCKYDNHVRNFQEQLDAGVRLLYVDWCLKSGVVINCHHSEEEKTEGESIATSLATVKIWLLENPRHAVIWATDRGWAHDSFALEDGTRAFEDSIGSTFGNCLDTSAALASHESSNAATLGCLRWPGILENDTDLIDTSSVTLGRNINADLRFIYAGPPTDRIAVDGS